jgi:hypothetical protein
MRKNHIHPRIQHVRVIQVLELINLEYSSCLDNGRMAREEPMLNPAHRACCLLVMIIATAAEECRS